VNGAKTLKIIQWALNSACLQSAIHPRVLNDTSRFAGITLVAPGERFNAFAILVTSCLSLAIDFNNRRSSLVHVRRISFFFGIPVPFLRIGFLSRQNELAM
jgi:hypothetical protein